jgi:hypothetical protein
MLCPRGDSNAQPTAPQAGALSIELRGQAYQRKDSTTGKDTRQGNAETRKIQSASREGAEYAEKAFYGWFIFNAEYSEG